VLKLEDELARLGRMIAQDHEDRIADYLPRYGEKRPLSDAVTTQTRADSTRSASDFLSNFAKLAAALPPAPHDTLYMTGATRDKLVAQVEPGHFNPLFPNRMGGMILQVHPARTLLRNKKSGEILGIISDEAVFAGHRHEIEVIEL